MLRTLRDFAALWSGSRITFAVAVLAASSAIAFAEGTTKLTVHGQITRDALAGTLADTNLKAVIDADDSQDITADGAKENRRHFDPGNLTAAMNYINREKNKALELAAEADTDLQSRADALRHFGLMLHSVQDFYLRSNYVEMVTEEPAVKQAPYDAPLVDWSKVPLGYEKLSFAKHGDSADPLNKECADSEAGKKVILGKATQFSLARDLAVRETQRQWNLFEALVRNRCGSRAAAVLAALRKAAPVGYGTAKSNDEAADYQ